MTEEPIQIYNSRSKSLGMLMLCLLFVAATPWMWFGAEDFDRWPPWFTRAVAVAGFLLFGAGAVLSLVAAVQRRVMLRIDAQGLHIGRRASRIVHVPWAQVRLFRKDRNFIVVELVDAQAFIAAEQRPGLKRTFNLNYKTLGYVVTIPYKVLEMNENELLGLLEDKLAKSRAPFRE